MYARKHRRMFTVMLFVMAKKGTSKVHLQQNGEKLWYNTHTMMYLVCRNDQNF